MSNGGDDQWLETDQLHFAAQDGDLDRARDLVARGFPVNAFDRLGMTPLHYAVAEGHSDVARFLIHAGADVNAQDERQAGNTPLGEVAGNCSLDIAQLLVEAGADPTIPGGMQLSALHKAERRKRGDGPRVYQLLLEAARHKGRGDSEVV